MTVTIVSHRGSSVATHSWADSDIFSNRMYGSAMNSPENSYQISEGWFRGVTSIYDPDSTFVGDIVSPGHNLYGYIDTKFNMQALPGIARTASYCGLKGEIEFATCNVIVKCFDDHDNISDWNSCMEDQVHAANHGMIGGGFNCNVRGTARPTDEMTGGGVACFPTVHLSFDSSRSTYTLHNNAQATVRRGLVFW